MIYTNDLLNYIYDKKSGYCHICGKKLSFTNYGITYTKGAWEVDHSNPKANGGSNSLNNLLPACINCNRSKQDRTTRAVRYTYENKDIFTKQELEFLKGLGIFLIVVGLAGLITEYNQQKVNLWNQTWLKN